MLLKGRFLLRSSFSIFPESVLKCWTSGAVRLRSRKSLRACKSVFNVCWNWGSRSPNSISFAARDSRNCCQSGSSLLDLLGDGSAALACRAFITISNSSFVRVRSGLCSSLVGTASSMAANGLSRRKFRSETSDNMDSWKAEVRRVRREKIRRKKMQMREKVGKSRFTVFFQWFVAPEGRKVGSLKRRVRTQLARWEMKKCTPLWREAHFQVKMYKTHQCRTTFGSWDVEKVHAVVARSTFASQNV